MNVDTHAKKIKVVMAKPGLDGHETGARLIARALVEAGMEVIYTGTRQAPEMIVKTTLEEDADVLGLSILSGAHKELSARIIALMQKADAGNVPIIVGGIIPDVDVPTLEEMGIAGVFGPGTATTQVVKRVKELVARKNSNQGVQKETSNYVGK